MRILRVAQKTYPDVKGGGPYHVHAMSRDQAAMGHDVTVLTVGAADADRPHVEERDGYTVVRYDSNVSLLGNDVSAGVAHYLAATESFDVMHAHSHLYFSTNLAALKRRFKELPLAITNHGLYSQTAPEWVFDRYLGTVGRWTFDQADVVFCYTEEDEHRLRGFGVESDIKVVPNGIDLGRFTPDGPESDLIDHDGPTALFVGRLVEGKRPLDAAGAVERVRETHPGLKLYVCGEGPLRAEMERSGEHVEFLGHVKYDEMPRVYRSADVLVLPSRAEGVPRTILEAMGSGIGVVTSNLEQVAPLVEGYGHTVVIGDIDGFASGIRAVLESGGPGTIREEIREELSWEGTVERTTNALERLVEER
jgi:glycogen synthase